MKHGIVLAIFWEIFPLQTNTPISRRRANAIYTKFRLTKSSFSIIVRPANTLSKNDHSTYVGSQRETSATRRDAFPGQVNMNIRLAISIRKPIVRNLGIFC